MELDELKRAWVQYDQKLSKSLELNEALLKKLNVSQSKLELRKPLMAEVTGVVSMFVMVIFLVIISFQFIGELQYAISGFISTAVALVYFTFALIKMQRLMNIAYYGTPVTVLQQEINEANRLILKLRKWELILAPFILISFPPIFKAIHHVDLYQNIQSFVITALVAVGVGLPGTLWINKYLYDKKFQNVEKLLKEIENYKSDPT